MSVVSAKAMAYYRGEKGFRDGKPCPPKPSDDSPCTEPHEIEWLGWRVAYAMQMLERAKVMEALGIYE